MLYIRFPHKAVENKLACQFLDAIIDSNHSSSKLKRDWEDWEDDSGSSKKKAISVVREEKSSLTLLSSRSPAESINSSNFRSAPTLATVAGIITWRRRAQLSPNAAKFPFRASFCALPERRERETYLASVAAEKPTSQFSHRAM